MTSETKSRIQTYMEELPFMKEKVFGALLMFVVAAVVVVSATYAWITLSRSPEANEIKTTLAANGALEIALVKPDGSQPDEFDIDESVERDTNVTVSNLQWGNLVNLSDSSYGIDNIALRPAELNLSDLLGNPLVGVVYGEDGRGVEKDSNYAYAKYNVAEKNFVTAKDETEQIFGVRAIVSYEAVVSGTAQIEYAAKMTEALNARSDVDRAYSSVGKQFSALGKMVSIYAEDRLNDTFTPLSEHIDKMLPVYEAIAAAMEEQKEAFVALANLQYYPVATATGDPFVPLTWDDVHENRTQYNINENGLDSANGTIALVKLNEFIADYNTIQNDIKYLKQYLQDYIDNNAKYYWYGYYLDSNGAKVYDKSVSGYTLDNIVNHLIDYMSMEVDLDQSGPPGTPVSTLSMNDIGELSSALGKNREVYILNGIMKRFEQYFVSSGSRISVDPNNSNYAACTITVKVFGIGGSVYGRARTMAEGPSWFEINYNNSLDGELSPTVGAAQDTFGLAVDLWARTNAEETYLILERPIAFDEFGNTYIYGANRVWGPTDRNYPGNQAHRTTQGGGSCYTYYADTPADMARSLELLKSMKVAFVDGSGNLLAKAGMDTANYWAVNGRVTVPLVLDSDAKSYTYFEDGTGEQVGRLITTMYADIPLRITAIIYLDGETLTNDDVLAAAEIQGSLNIQFASSENLDTVIEESDKMYSAERTVIAQFVGVDEENRLALVMDHNATPAGRTATIQLDIDGDQPDEVTAFFVRAINSTQGSREEPMEFLRQEDGTWICQHIFAAPGIYYLRQVRLNGADYTLDAPLTVTVRGISLKSATLVGAPAEPIYTSEDTYPVEVRAEFSSDDLDQQPETVQIRFTRAGGGVVSVPLTYNSGTRLWEGKTTLTVSGEYTMDYVAYTIAGDTTTYFADLNPKPTLDLSLGMRVFVDALTGGFEMEYDKDAPDGTYAKDVAVKVYNNAGAEVKEQTGLILYYARGGSASDTRSATLVWDELEEHYVGTLFLDKPGRYVFYRVKMGNQYLTKYTEKPATYNIYSTEVPNYLPASATTMAVQPVAYANGALLDGIAIENSESAFVSFVVYNDKADEYFACTFDPTDEDSEQATISGNKWTAVLPTYTKTTDADGNPLAEPVQTQDGTWSLVSVCLWNCYDEDGNLRQIMEDDPETEEDETQNNPILWVGSDAVSQAWLSENGLTAEKTLDFSALSTTVTSTVAVTVTPSETAFGGTDTAFLTTIDLDVLGDPDDNHFIKVEVTDADGNRIPSDKIGAMKLRLKYVPNTAQKAGYQTYGYAVTSGTSASYEFELVYNNEVDAFVVKDNDAKMQYVGEYTVEGLTVEFNDGTEEGRTETYTPASNIGLPEKYTMTTKGPGTNDILVTVANPVTLGKYGNTVNGTFLQSYNLGTNFPVTVSLKNADNASFVDTSNLLASTNPVQLVLNYQNGTTAPNGGYTWSGQNSYTTITPTMTTSGNRYIPNLTTPLLAGTYHVAVTVKLADGTTKTVPAQGEAPIAVAVHSKLPDVTMALFAGDANTSATPTTVDVSMTGDIYAVSSALMFEGTNVVANNGHSAVVFMEYALGAADAEHSDSCGSEDEEPPNVDRYANYTKPMLTFTLSDVGTDLSTTLSIRNNEETVSWAKNSEKTTAGIGTITRNAKHTDGSSHMYWGYINCSYYYTTEKVSVVGEQMVDTITSTDSKGIQYKRTLATPLSIVQNNSAIPSLEFIGVEEPFVTPTDQYSADGRSFTYTLPTVYTAGGAASVTSAVERMTGQEITGADVTSQLPAISSLTGQDDGWTTTKVTLENAGQVFTRVNTSVAGTHDHWAFVTYQQNHYGYTVDQRLYNKSEVEQQYLFVHTEEDADIENVTNYDVYDAVRELDYWLIGDTRYEPGDTVTVSGNLQARAVFKTTETKTGTKKLIEATAGTVRFEYYITCDAVVMTEGQYKRGETGIYCQARSCGTYTAKRSDSAAKSAADTDLAAITDILDSQHKIGVDEVKTVRSNVSDWQYGGMFGGTKSTRIEYYDLDGNLIDTETT